MSADPRQNNDGLAKPLRDKRLANLSPGGRKKGAVNRTTKLAKDAIAIAAEKLGGADRLFAWAQEDPDNERVFWQSIYTKLIPVQVTGENGGPLRAAIEVVFKAPDAS